MLERAALRGVSPLHWPEAVAALASYARSLERRNGELERELKVSDKLIAERNRVLVALECDVHGPCVPGALEKIADINKRLEDSRSYVAEVAQGISHLPHAEGAPCVKCRLEEAEAEARLFVDVAGANHAAWVKARAEIERLSKRITEVQALASKACNAHPPEMSCAWCRAEPSTLRQGGGGE